MDIGKNGLVPDVLQLLSQDNVRPRTKTYLKRKGL